MKTIPERIVAEITRNWLKAEPEKLPLKKPPICQQFERIIAINKIRGYDLESWQMNTTLSKAAMVETIIAVFVKVKSSQGGAAAPPYPWAEGRP